MEIAIKSECDSRALLYPLIKTLYPYGIIAVYSSNKSLSRLIENELEGGFRNVRIVVNTDGDLEAAKLSDGYYKDKYDFIIYDNMGAVDYDILLCMVTNRISESYMFDLVNVGADEKAFFLKFGSPAPASKKEKPSKPVKKAKAQDVADAAEDAEIESNRNFNKWNQEKSDEEELQDRLLDKSLKWCKFPTFDTIEEMESRFKMIVPDETLIVELYRIFGKYLSVDEYQFKKGARLKDEGSSTISGADVR